jgi:hypothetical protein
LRLVLLLLLAAVALPCAAQAEPVYETERVAQDTLVDAAAPDVPVEVPDTLVDRPPVDVPAPTEPSQPPAEPPPVEEPLPAVAPPAAEAPPAEQPPAAEPPPDTGATPEAVNRSRIVQVIVQVQVGCRRHCDGTSQAQTAIQQAQTEQSATAPDGVAVNVSVTEQYVWQLQLGCVAFCTATVQSQSVQQSAQTIQTATGAQVVNVAATVQVVQQSQAGHRRRQRRSIFAEVGALLRELAKDTTATVQVIRQIQVSACRSHCTGDTQVQLAVQSALAAQEAAVLASD